VNDLSSSEKEFINKCSIILSKKQIEIDSVLYPISEEDFKTVQVLSRKYFKRKSQSLIMYKNLKQYKKIKNEIKLKKMVDELEQSPNLFSKIVLLSIYNSLNLQGKVNSIINSILSTEFSDQFFLEEYSLSENRELSRSTFDVLKELKDNYGNQLQFDSLVAYLSIHLDPYLKDMFNDEFSIPDRLSFVQEKTQSFNNAKRFPFAWTHWIEKYSSEKELLKFMDQALIYERLDGNPELLTGFYSSFPKEESKRNKLGEAFKTLKKSTNLVLKEKAIRSLENEAFFNYLVTKKMTPLNALFVEKKKIYSLSLKNNTAILYSIFNLLRLGNFEDKYLIYLYASRL
jgi:hypothetical protein